MPLDPSEDRWIRDRLDAGDARAAELIRSANDASKKLVALNMRLRMVENREKTWKGLCATLALALFGSIGGIIHWAGSLASDIKHVAETSAAVKELAKEFHEHERRSSVPKPEGR